MMVKEFEFTPSQLQRRCAGKRVLIRVDLDLNPTGWRGKRISPPADPRGDRLTVVTNLLAALKKSRQVILIGHRGRPVGRTPSLSLKSFASLLGCTFCNWKPSQPLPKNKYLLLENIRFFPGEEADDQKLAQALAALGDIFINEAFATSHRAHASIVSLPNYLPSFLGPNFCQEIKKLNEVSKQKRGLAIVLGGAKLETKLPLIERFRTQADLIILAGLTGLEFLRAHNASRGRLVGKQARILTPFDFITPRGLTSRLESDIFDIGPASITSFLSALKSARLIVWNGPFGQIENEKFTDGTLSFAYGLAKLKAKTIVGGGDTISFIQAHNLTNHFSFLSTGGGAMLDYLAYGSLPGLEAIKTNR